MSKHGRMIKCGCGAEVPVNRENLRRKNQPGGFQCKRCEKREVARAQKKQHGAVREAFGRGQR